MMPRTRVLRTALTLALCALFCVAANAQQGAPQPASQSGQYTLSAGTQLVVVDVVVEDASGKPIHGLTRDIFTVTEDKKPQAIRNFEAHTEAESAKPVPALPQMPPGIFTNYAPVPPGAALNILLLDTFNTPLQDQAFVHDQLQQYVRKADPHQRIAIFGLSSHLYMLQGFTSDPAILKNSVDKLGSRQSTLLADPSHVGASEKMSDYVDLGDPGIAAMLIQFEAETATMQNQTRIQFTLDAFNDIAHYLSNFPGRKNLIWFSGSFPVNLLPDNTLDDAFSVMHNNDEEFQQITNLLGRAQVAVYPIDVRGLITNPALSATSNQAINYTPPPNQRVSAAPNKTQPKPYPNTNIKTMQDADDAKTLRMYDNFTTTQFEEHSTMDRMAEATGGHAFYNTNGLAEATAQALDSGANYYTLTYNPTNQKLDGNFRSIKVALTGQYANQSLKLTYRRGYYADDLVAQKKAAAPGTIANATALHAADSYRRSAISHGSPLPEDILFKVRAVPASTTPESKLAPNNKTNPANPIKGPFLRYAIDFVTLPSDFKLASKPDGTRTGAIDFSVYVYSPDGVQLNSVGNTIKYNFPPAAYQDFLNKSVNYHLEVSAPVKGESYLRIVIHDLASNRFGAVEVPVSTISKLPPSPTESARQPAPTH